MKCAIWARVSTTDQHASNQLDELRAWADARQLDVAEVFTTEDSAWTKNGNGGSKGAEFDDRRAALIEGARMGRYQVVLVWGIDRLSRRGAEDMLACVRRLTDTGCALWSLKDPWVESTTDPFVRELMIGIFGTIARFESERRSARIKAGLERRKREGKPVGGANSKRGKDKRPRRTDGYRQTWAAGGARRTASAEGDQS